MCGVTHRLSQYPFPVRKLYTFNFFPSDEACVKNNDTSYTNMNQRRLDLYLGATSKDETIRIKN